MSRLPDTNEQRGTYSIQRASLEQANSIKTLVRSSGINPSGLDWQRFLVALDKDKNLIGCGQLKPHADGSMELASIAVEPKWRRRRVATAIIEGLLGEYDGPLYLMCQSSLGPLYEKFGFQSIGEHEMPKYFRRVRHLAGVLGALRDQGESLLIMRRLPG